MLLCERAACCLAGIRVGKIRILGGGRVRAAESAQCMSLKVLIDELLVAILFSYSPNSGEFEPAQP